MDTDKDIKTENVEEKPEDKSPENLSDLTPTPNVPTVDKDAPLAIDEITKSSVVPTVDKNERLKIEDVQEEDEDLQEKSNKKLFIIGGLILAVIIMLTIGFFVFSTREVQEEKTDTTVAETPAPKATEAPKKTLNRSEWSIEVLNGSGIPGGAKKIADKLKELGYMVSKTGNADKDDYETDQILIKKELNGSSDLFVADIKDVVRTATVSGEVKDSTASAVIIIGKK